METIIDFGPIQFVKGEKGGRYPFCNSIFIPGAGVLIDPSSHRETLLELKPRITSIWLSHWHEDHIMHLDLFDDLPLSLHEQDEPPLKNIDTFVDWYGLDRERDRPLIEHWKKMLVELFHFRPRSASTCLNGEDSIDLDGLRVDIIHVPGHSPGHLAFFFPEIEILFTGDYDLTSFGPWYGDRYSSIDDIIASVHRLKQIPASICLTGHEEGVFHRVDEANWNRYLSVIDQREEALYELLKEPKTLAEIGDAWIVYGKPIKPVEEFNMIEQISMKKHADRLIKQGLIAFDGDVYYRIQ